MPLNHLIRDGDNPDITEERQKATFSTEELAKEIYGGWRVLLDFTYFSTTSFF